ncbi:tripartite tricarboxylate transporter TctB family protein [Aestuariivita sp.]|uniref:tripartite tricarboxylate transporter TctB family protein n=1 Tax=Aestuariivita sp. TaxID=1872407 RepID=UPI00216FA06C|nr:tripartite tricarboxylate transporter TctB family protein [Aestuariivita sp.]MCE8009245.1 tripartite tricarboxylate transporter TctB family protein [Aestuariivita sp.]
MSSEKERRFAGPRRGQLVFALGFIAISGLLIVQIGVQTVWVDGVRLAAQPRFWPAVGLGLMVAMAGLHLWRLPWRRVTRFDRTEALRWLMVLEYCAWFMAYVLLVPILGYLPVTLIFVSALAWRMGYRSRGMMAISALFAISVVVIFKSLLSVRIPGGAIYEYLPGALRSFAILNL